MDWHLFHSPNYLCGIFVSRKERRIRVSTDIRKKAMSRRVLHSLDQSTFHQRGLRPDTARSSGRTGVRVTTPARLRGGAALNPELLRGLFGVNHPATPAERNRSAAVALSRSGAFGRKNRVFETVRPVFGLEFLLDTQEVTGSRWCRVTRAALDCGRCNAIRISRRRWVRATRERFSTRLQALQRRVPVGRRPVGSLAS